MIYSKCKNIFQKLKEVDEVPSGKKVNDSDSFATKLEDYV